MDASRNGHTATVELLLAAGADKDAKNEVRD
jgi:ankyrin repeat protein